MKYTTFKELNGKTLQEGDIVSFRDTDYQVRRHYLENTMGSNSEILLKLNMNDEYIRHVYGYEATIGAWRESKLKDYEALTRLVLCILFKIENPKDDIKILMPNGEWRLIKNSKLGKLYKMVTIKLTSTYTAELKFDYVKVGCQEIPYEKNKRSL